MTRSATVGADRVVRAAAPVHAVRVTGLTHAGPGLSGAVLVGRALGHAVHTVTKVAAFRAVFGTGPVTAAVAFRMTRRARLVASLVKPA